MVMVQAEVPVMQRISTFDILQDIITDRLHRVHARVSKRDGQTSCPYLIFAGDSWTMKCSLWGTGAS